MNLTQMIIKIMTSGPITSWKIDGETVETVADFIWGGSKITVDGDCSHRIKTQEICPFHYRGLECKSRKSRNT